MDMKKAKKLMKAFNSNLDLYERPEYRITEKNKRPYIVHSLEVEYEDGELYFGDDDSVLLVKNSLLNELRSEWIKDIVIHSNKYTIELSKELGQVTIELIK
jgi:hypothetical protein